MESQTKADGASFKVKAKKNVKILDKPVDAKVEKVSPPPVIEAIKAATDATHSPSREELKARFEAKMQSFKSQRGADKPKNKQHLKKVQEKRDQKKVEKVVKKTVISQKKTEPIVETGNQMFSKFDFGLNKDGKKKSVTPSNPKQALQKVIARTEKIKALEETDQGKAEQMKRSDAWAKAIQKAQGLAVKDDPKLLKKSITKLDKAKEKRSKNWNDRKQAVKYAEVTRQKKRQENIDARKEQKKAGKNGKGGKGAGKPKPKSAGANKKRPGFEGGHFKKIQKRK